MRTIKRLLPLLLAMLILAGCGAKAYGPEDLSGYYVGRLALEELDLENEALVLADSAAAVDKLLLPVASGVSVKKSSRAVIDYSNTKDGYVMVQFTGSSSKRLRVQVAGPTTTYTYDLPVKVWTTFPLSDGNGSYKVTVFENVQDNKYAQETSVSFKVALTDEFAPFLRPNQYVDYASAPNTILKAAELTEGITEPLEQVKVIYDFVVTNLTYDKQRAATVKTGYLPVLDSVLKEKKGICFDYASLMTGMLRSLGIPCKLVVGYAGKQYHAWINVWTKEAGWIDAVIYFDGSAWQRMDPTFASSGKQSASIMKYIGDGKNYTVKYLY